MATTFTVIWPVSGMQSMPTATYRLASHIVHNAVCPATSLYKRYILQLLLWVSVYILVLHGNICLTRTTSSCTLGITMNAE